MDPAVSPRSVGVRYVDSLRMKDTLVKNDSVQSSERDPAAHSVSQRDNLWSERAASPGVSERSVV